MSGKRLVIQPFVMVCLLWCTYAQSQVPNEPVTTLHVPAVFATIQEAIDAATEGDIVEIAPGRYMGPGNCDIDFKGKPITVRGSADVGKTVIVCREDNTASVQGHRGFYFHSNETPRSLLQNVTIEQGWIPGELDLSLVASGSTSTEHFIGGGIFCDNSSPTLINVRILRCQAAMGGGIGCVAGSPTLVNCEVAECIAGGQGDALSGGMGGGIALIGGTHLRMTYCIIRDNKCLHDSHGAGVFIQNSSASIEQSDISRNKATGILMGGGLYVAAPAFLSPGREPTLNLQRRGVSLRHCLMTGNVAERGAAVFVQRWSMTDEAAPVQDTINSIPPLSMINTTVAANRLPDRAQDSVNDPPGAIVETQGQSIEIRNSILWHNKGESLRLEPASRAWVSFSNIESRFPGPGNIHKDPLFVDVSGNDFHLKSRVGRFDPQKNSWVSDLVHSPCIDRGHPDDPVLREPEPHAQRINMGAYGGTVQASKGFERRVWHVDNAVATETNTGLTPNDAFLHIQAAVDAAHDGDTVLIWPGTYIERQGIVVKGKAITIQGALGAPLIKTPGDIAFSFYYGERNDSVLSNLIISSSQYAVFCSGASPTLQHLTVVNNDFGVYALDGSDPIILNSIFWDNGEGDLYCDGQIQCRADYSCIEHSDESMGLGNIFLDPLFVDPAHEDFHLRSQQGHYGIEADGWVQDSSTSPCIDAGYPTLSPVQEPGPNGGRLNMGAYGGTDQASLSLRPNITDGNSDRIVDQTVAATNPKTTDPSGDRP